MDRLRIRVSGEGFGVGFSRIGLTSPPSCKYMASASSLGSSDMSYASTMTLASPSVGEIGEIVHVRGRMRVSEICHMPARPCRSPHWPGPRYSG